MSTSITTDIANKMLSLVRPITEEIARNWAQIQEVINRLGKDQADYVALGDKLEKLARSLNNNIDELEELGCIVDSYKGTIDFPSKLDGDEVMLCWSLGEQEVLHYHRPGDVIKRRLLLKETLE